MSAPPPIPMQWDGESFRPASPHWARQADRHFVVGQTYPLEVREDRSAASHRAYFAAVNEAHKNLPDELAERFPTPDALRRFALIRTGHRDERSIACASKAEALRVAAFVKPMDYCAVVTVVGALVTVYTARSQSMRAMDRATFQKSKDDVLRYLAEMLGTTPRELQSSEAA